MTEADEVAAVLARQIRSTAASCRPLEHLLDAGWTFDECAAFVRMRLPGESPQVIDNVALSLQAELGGQ